MILFLTSSPTGPLDGSRRVNGLDESNGFVYSLRRYWKKDARCLMITAAPDAYAQNEEMIRFFRNSFSLQGFSYKTFHLLDRRNANYSKSLLQSYDVIILGGGHVPTQNRFFQEIKLREKLEGYDGMIIGISAGTMNCADTVYAQPELPGEAVDPDYERYYQGLGLTQTKILPHYQMVKDNWLDGMRLYEDITYADSMGQELLVLVDGSYVLSVDGEESIHGEAYLIKDGVIEQIYDR